MPHLRLAKGQAKEPTDDEILQAWESGDPRFGEMFYDHLVGVVDRTLCRVMGERTVEHDDLAQNAFEQILLSLTKGKFQRACSLKSWAAAVTSRIALNAIRTRRTERRYFDRKLDQSEVGPRGNAGDLGREVQAKETFREVRAHLSQLSEKRAQALVLHDALGYDLAEVAALTGVTVAAAQSRLVRGRKELHENLREAGIMMPEEQNG